ncbi:cytochrome d ubiquinol oxidase subunit II [Desulfonema ishimotonii]|uniref:Cytochrome d ubiquinol oxidase subunit II n=1 Tax=Desulfonema ishimotonii TaxID=45657 RepID=A0A401G0G0_9BACT|nr:cytochrome d ubiquinol oxidase subunit II [Desulfonema ishimotonii]GBC62701.1 cytochrome d ubiquinol oxidase subunit II [Desulfonema ishimotonii]
MALQITWFFIWGLLWAVFFMTDGFDFGIGSLLPFMARNDREKRIMINAMGPFWDGNEVWLVAAGGVTFAAFPLLYATMFSSLYSALMLILFALILRGVAMEFRGQSENPVWRQVWDLCIFGGSLVPAILFGVAFANIFRGVPIDQNGVYHGTLFTLLNGYGLLGGALFLLMFLEHGALWLAIKTEGDLHDRAVRFAGGLWWILVAVALLFLICTKFETRLYDNYYANPILFLLVIVNLAAFIQIKLFLIRKAYFTAWFSSALAIVCCTFFGIIGLFPSVFPSSIDAAYSLTAFNSSSSPLTLKIMLIVVATFVPIVLAYQIWAYHLFSGKVTEEDLASEDAY